MDLVNYIQEDTNFVEIYWLPRRKLDAEIAHFAEEPFIEVGAVAVPDEEFCAAILTSGQPAAEDNWVEYVHRDMVYRLSCDNDSQKVLRRHTHREDLDSSGWFYLVSGQEETLPTHMFPCSTEMTYKRMIHRRVYRISHRVFVIVETEMGKDSTFYIRYNHADRMDLQRAQRDVFRAMGLMRRVIRGGGGAR